MVVKKKLETAASAIGQFVKDLRTGIGAEHGLLLLQEQIMRMQLLIS